jgi:integrase
LKNRGLREATLSNIHKALKVLAKHASLDDAEQVKTFIASLNASEGYKRNLAYSYDCYVKVHKLFWVKPKYYLRSKLPKIPSEEKINMIIANASKKTALAISISKDTGLRPVEVMGLKLKDVDVEKALVYAETAKHGNARVLKLKSSSVNLLVSFLSKHKEIGLNDKIFGSWTSSKYGSRFRHYRNKVAEKLNDVSIRSIRLYYLRHFYATKLYSMTRNILLVKQQLGHRKIETTLLYTQLVDANGEEDFVCEMARTVEEAKKLIEQAFDYVTEIDGIKLFRKRK